MIRLYYLPRLVAGNSMKHRFLRFCAFQTETFPTMGTLITFGCCWLAIIKTLRLCFIDEREKDLQCLNYQPAGRHFSRSGLTKRAEKITKLLTTTEANTHSMAGKGNCFPTEITNYKKFPVHCEEN